MDGAAQGTSAQSLAAPRRLVEIGLKRRDDDSQARDIRFARVVALVAGAAESYAA
jgi:hypothetical protein